MTSVPGRVHPGLLARYIGRCVAAIVSLPPRFDLDLDIEIGFNALIMISTITLAVRLTAYWTVEEKKVPAFAASRLGYSLTQWYL